MQLYAHGRRRIAGVPLNLGVVGDPRRATKGHERRVVVKGTRVVGRMRSPNPLRAITIPENLSTLSRGKTGSSRTVARPLRPPRSAGGYIEGQRYFRTSERGPAMCSKTCLERCLAKSHPTVETPFTPGPRGTDRDPSGTLQGPDFHRLLATPSAQTQLPPTTSAAASPASNYHFFLCGSVCICGSSVLPSRPPSRLRAFVVAVLRHNETNPRERPA